MTRKSLQCYLATGVCIFGCLLLIASFVINPTGEIHSSVLAIFGEIEGTSLALFGIERFPVRNPN